MSRTSGFTDFDDLAEGPHASGEAFQCHNEDVDSLHQAVHVVH